MKKAWVVITGNLGKEEVYFLPSKKEAKALLKIKRKTNLFVHIEKTRVSDAKYQYMMRDRRE
jgi:hypothetical protein